LTAWWSWGRWPSPPWSDWDSSLLEFSGKGLCVDAELGGDRPERLALLVSSRRLSNGAVGHLAYGSPAWHTAPVEVTDHRGAVDGEAASERVDREALDVCPGEIV